MAKTKPIVFLKYSLFVVLTFILIKCASQLPPGGGEVDTIPPEIIDSYPINGTTNFSDDYFEITFSEYVDKRSVQDAIFISPTIEGGIDYDWSGKTLEVSFKDTLRINTTYTVTIGTDVVDYNNRNRMADAYSISFSTGSTIDHGEIHGNIYDKEPSGVMVYAYKMNSDTLDPSKQKPDYVSQVGKKGNYKLLGLSNGRYRVLAMKDEYRDFLYNVEQDKFGTPYTDVNLTNEDSVFVGLNFYLSVEDTTPPRVLSAIMTDRNHILVEFSENIDSTWINSKNFFVLDSTSNRKLETTYFYKGQGKPNQFFLTVADSLTENSEVYLVSQNILDRKFNKTKYELTNLTLNSKHDTLSPKLLRTVTEFENKTVDFDSAYVIFYFDDAFPNNQIGNAVKILDKNDDQIPFTIIHLDDASFRINIAKKLKPKSNYKIELGLNFLVDIAGNKIDSVYKYDFSTINDLDFTGISGRVNDRKESSKKNVVLQNAEIKELIYLKTVSDDLSFDFNKIIPGKYLIWSYEDINNNDKYDCGTLNPFALSEQFVFYPDTLNVRARWPIGDVLIEFK